MQKGKDARLVWIFVAVAFGLGILLSGVIGLTGGHNSKLINLGYLTMFIPAAAVLIIRSLGEPFPEMGWDKFPLKWLPTALFIFPVIIHLVCLPVIALQNDFGIPWQPWLSAGADGLLHSPPERNWGILSKTGLVFRILLNAFTGIIAVSFFAFFEEVGWRAWLMPKLMDRFGLKSGVLMSAIIWALWHVPFMLSGIFYVENVPMYISVLFYPLGIFGTGIILGWLWIRTKSIWIVSLAHGSLNNWGQYAFKYMSSADSSGKSIALIVALNGALLVAGLIVFFQLKDKKSGASGI